MRITMILNKRSEDLIYEVNLNNNQVGEAFLLET